MSIYPKLLAAISLLVTFPVLLSSCNQTQSETDKDIIAAVGDSYTLSFSRLNNYVNNQFLIQRNPDRSALDIYEEAAEKLMDDQLKRYDFFERNLHEEQELLLPIQRNINEELITAYFNQEFLGEHLTEENIQNAYEKMDREVTYRQIVLNKPEESGSDELEEIQNLVTSIRDRLDEGQDFGELVLEYSQDEETARRGGYARPVTWERSLREPVLNIAFDLEPDEFRTVETQNAYYIIEVTEVETIEKPSFEEARAEIREELRNNYIEPSLDEYDEFLDELVDEESFEWNSDGLEQIIEWTQETSRFFREAYRDTMQQAIENGNNFTILTHADGTVDLEEYLRLLDHVLIPGTSSSYDSDDLKSHLTEAMKEDIVGRRAREAGLFEDIFHPGTDNDVLQNRIVSKYNRHVIQENTPDATEENLREFYESKKDELFYQLHTVNTRIIVADDETHANELIERYQAGTDFNDLAHTILIRQFYRDRDGTVHTRHEVDQPNLGDEAMELSENEITGPVTFYHPEQGPKPAIMIATRVRDEGVLAYEDISDKVEEEFKEHHREKVESELLDELRQKYTMTFYEDHLRAKLEERDLL